MKYNRLELILLADTQYHHLDYQPLLKMYSAYILSGSYILSYGKKLTQAIKREIITKIITNEILMHNFKDGYPNEFNFYDGVYMDTVYTFTFKHIKRGFEHEAIEALPDSDMRVTESGEQWGVLEDNTILNQKQTLELLQQLKEQQRTQELELLAKSVYESPTSNMSKMFSIIGIESTIKDFYGEVKTIEEARTKYKELAKIHHPDMGGDELTFKAIIAGGKYLKAKLSA